MITFILLILTMRSLASVPYRQRFERLHSGHPLVFKILDPAEDDFTDLAGLNLYRQRSFLIQFILKFSNLFLEAPVVHDIPDFRQKPSDQGRIFF